MHSYSMLRSIMMAIVVMRQKALITNYEHTEGLAVSRRIVAFADCGFVTSSLICSLQIDLAAVAARVTCHFHCCHRQGSSNSCCCSFAV